MIQVPILWIIISSSLGGCLVGWGLVRLFDSFLKPSEASSIAIFGSKGAGKTTLWKQLQGEFQNKNYIPTLGVDTIDEFTIELNKKKKTIKKSADYGGGDDLVKRYGEIINDKTFIYYLIDLTRLSDVKKETRSRLQAITKVIKDRKIESGTGIKLVGTHFEEFQTATGFDKNKAKEQLVDYLGLKNIKDVKVDDVILIAELTDKNDVEQIMNQIIS